MKKSESTLVETRRILEASSEVEFLLKKAHEDERMHDERMAASAREKERQKQAVSGRRARLPRNSFHG